MTDAVMRGPGAAVLLVCAGLAVAAGCATTPPAPLLSGRECPMHQDAIVVSAGGQTATFDTLPLVGRITGVPGYHDCQRFVDEEGTSYGPLIAIYAIERLGTVDVTGATLAVVVNFDPVGYAPLGIEPGINCLVLFPAPGGVGARMVPVGVNAAQCLTASASDPGATLLAHPREMTGGQPDDYPPVARWDWDHRGRKQFISMRCGPRWCEVGPSSGFAHTTDRPFDHIPDRAERRVLDVKGWHDAQPLAHTAGRSLAPKSHRATVVPVKNLASITINDFASGWQDVARVAITGSSDEYWNKFAFAKASLSGSKQNVIALCTGSWDECRARDARQPDLPAPTCKAPSADGRMWWARVTSAPKRRLIFFKTVRRGYFCVDRVAHSVPGTPGTARWRWLNADEGEWGECDHGCCKLQGGGGQFEE